MHVALTDVLTCPRCGPGHGLVLLPEEVRERRVIAGFLGCADCRARYPIREGVAELAVDGGRPGVPGGEAAGGTTEGAVRLAGLLGLADADGVVVLAGPAAAHAGELAALVPGVEVVATLDGAVAGVSTARLGRTLPFQSGRLRGVALTGAASALLEEGARVLGGASRLLLEPAPGNARGRLEGLGLRVVAEEGATVVAGR